MLQDKEGSPQHLQPRVLCVKIDLQQLLVPDETACYASRAVDLELWWWCVSFNIFEKGFVDKNIYGSISRDKMFAETSEISCFLSSHPSQLNSLAPSSVRPSNSSLLVSYNCSDVVYCRLLCPFMIELFQQLLPFSILFLLCSIQVWMVTQACILHPFLHLSRSFLLQSPPLPQWLLHKCH